MSVMLVGSYSVTGVKARHSLGKATRKSGRARARKMAYFNAAANGGGTEYRSVGVWATELNLLLAHGCQGIADALLYGPLRTCELSELRLKRLIP